VKQLGGNDQHLFTGDIRHVSFLLVSVARV